MERLWAQESIDFHISPRTTYNYLKSSNLCTSKFKYLEIHILLMMVFIGVSFPYAKSSPLRMSAIWLGWWENRFCLQAEPILHLVPLDDIIPDLNCYMAIQMQPGGLARVFSMYLICMSIAISTGVVSFNLHPMFDSENTKLVGTFYEGLHAEVLHLFASSYRK